MTERMNTSKRLRTLLSKENSESADGSAVFQSLFAGIYFAVFAVSIACVAIFAGESLVEHIVLGLIVLFPAAMSIFSFADALKIAKKHNGESSF